MPSPAEPAAEESIKEPVSEDSEMKDVNGAKEQTSPDAPATKDESAVQAPASPPRSATPNAAAADETMDVDTPTERPDLSSSVEHADSTQNTSAVSENVTIASPQEISQSADVAKLDIKSRGLEHKDEPMPDRAASPAKVSRERSLDEEDEPSAKRTKLDSVVKKPVEPKTEKVGDNIGVASSVLSPAPDGEVDNLVDDIPNEKPLKEFHGKEIRKELARVKKTKNGMHFRGSVERLWTSIWENYKALIKNPVDLSLFEAKLRDNKYATFGDFKADLRLLYENSYKYNGAANAISIAAFRVRNDLFAKLSEVSKLEEPSKPDKAKAQPTRHVEHRAATQPRRQSQSQPRATATSPKPKAEAAAAIASTSTPNAAPAFALPPNGVPQIRRDSTRDDGDRPKRPIHPPKNRDPDYGAQNSRKKKLEPEMKFYADVLGDLKKQKYWTQNQWFLEPVDPVALNIPNYFSVIKKPMDLKTMTEKLEDGQYRSGKEVEKDMRQIVANSELFNGISLVTQCAQELEGLFKQKVAEKENWMSKNYPPSAHSATASAASPEVSDLESEADSEVEEDSSESVRNVQSRLLEEQNKLNDMLGAKKPDMTMIEIQQNVVSMLQRKLVEEKSKVGSSKKTKTQKKPTSKGKAKSSASQGAGGSANKKTTGGASATSKNRPANSKKPSSKKRHIGVMEKQVITDGIGELDGPTLDKAVDIIKKDTNQKEDDDGRLELDIEVLSQDALGRLFELINKSYPNIYATVSKRPEFSNNSSSSKVEKPAQSPGHSANPSKPRKNKPMNKDEQERKIEQLRELKAQFQRQGSNSQEPVPEDEEQRPGNSSEDSDSEEE